MSFSTDSKVGELLDHEATRAILEKHLPGLSRHPQINMARGMGLAQVAKFSGGLISDEALLNIGADLKTLG
jgi:hypothetical protein